MFITLEIHLLKIAFRTKSLTLEMHVSHSMSNFDKFLKNLLFKAKCGLVFMDFIRFLHLKLLFYI